MLNGNRLTNYSQINWPERKQFRRDENFETCTNYSYYKVDSVCPADLFHFHRGVEMVGQPLPFESVRTTRTGAQTAPHSTIEEHRGGDATGWTPVRGNPSLIGVARRLINPAATKELTSVSNYTFATFFSTDTFTKIKTILEYQKRSTMNNFLLKTISIFN